MSYPDETNLDHPYQGRLRFAPLDYAALRGRCAEDFGSDDYKLVLTHIDQLHSSERANLYSNGPTHADVVPMARRIGEAA